MNNKRLKAKDKMGPKGPYIKAKSQSPQPSGEKAQSPESKIDNTFAPIHQLISLIRFRPKN